MAEAKLLKMNADFLEHCYKQLWMGAGASEEHARAVARNVSLGDRQGKIYQGMGVLEAILIPLQAGILDIKAEPEIESEGPTWVLYNGNKSSGYYTITKMTEKAIEKAREYGIAIAYGYNHNDAGSFFGFTSLALEQGMFAMTSNNSVPLSAPYGGRDFAMSVPPFDAACPGGEELPLVTSTKLCEGYDADITEALLNDTKLKAKLIVDPETGELTDDVKPYASLIEGYGRVSDCTAPWIFSNPRLYSLNIWNEVMTAINEFFLCYSVSKMFKLDYKKSCNVVLPFLLILSLITAMNDPFRMKVVDNITSYVSVLVFIWAILSFILTFFKSRGENK